MAPKIKQDLTVQHVGEESLVLDLESGQIHQLNVTAAWILERCDGETSIESITRDFAEDFALDAETAMRDVDTMLEQLKQINVIDLDRDS